ncbi:putative isoleucyl-tRNA synthetase [Cryomyces antarcticus]
MLKPTRVLAAAVKSWKHTLNLPQSAFPARPSAQDTQKYLKSCSDELYAWQLEHRPASLPRGTSVTSSDVANNIFVLHDGPPYANGQLHIGHALNKILKDLILRVKLAEGKRVHFVPGWDCHGLPIEMKALQLRRQPQLEVGLAGGDTQIRRVARELATKTIEAQKADFRKWGILGDWDNAYKTMEKGFELRQLEVFREMVVNGLIHRDYAPVHWSPSSGTALAESELEYDEDYRVTAAFIKFPLVKLPDLLARHPDLNAKNISAVIWTTTPWTLPANKAIAVRSNMAYTVVELPAHGQLLVSKDRLEHVLSYLGEATPRVVVDSVQGSDLVDDTEYINVLSGESRPVIHADFVKSSSGTGLVHLAPGHGIDDYNACSKHGVAPFSPVDDEGRFTNEALPSDPQRLEGKAVQSEGVTAVLELLEDTRTLLQERNSSDAASSLVLATHEHRMKHALDWRTKLPVLVRATKQWFANLDKIKGDALRSLEKVDFVPNTGRARLESFVQSRSQWCISRQRAWGVPIPALYHKATGEAVLTGESINHILKVIEQRGIDSWWTDNEDEQAWIAPGLEGSYFRGTDTMDVWFDSGTTWTSLKPRPTHQPIADVYLEGTDQHRGWFQSSLLTHVAHQIGSTTSEPEIMAPFKTLITHGFTLDQDGRKMAKSEGNVISPEEIMNGTLLSPLKSRKQSGKSKVVPSAEVPTYDAMGVDALRLWVAGADYTNDVIVGQPVLQAVNTSLHKYRVTFKWLLGVLANYKPTPCERTSASAITNTVDRIAFLHLVKTSTVVHSAYASHEFHKATSAIYKYVVNDLSAFYFETLKDRLYAGSVTDRATAQRVVLAIYEELLAMLAPVSPLLVEEVWAFTPEHIKSSVGEHPLRRLWTPFVTGWSDKEAEAFQKGVAVLESVHDAIKSIQEVARTDKKMGSGLECDVRIDVTDDTSAASSLLMSVPPGELAEIFVVGNVTSAAPEVAKESMPLEEQESPDWTYEANFVADAGHVRGKVLVAAPRGKKCLRCWRFVAPVPDSLCKRCEQVVEEMDTEVPGS